MIAVAPIMARGDRLKSVAGDAGALVMQRRVHGSNSQSLRNGWFALPCTVDWSPPTDRRRSLCHGWRCMGDE